MDASLDLYEMVSENEGYLLASEAVASGISRQQISLFVKKEKLKKVSQGIYISEDAWVDDLYLLHLRNAKIIFSHESALYLHGLMEREPSGITVTVKFGYNAEHLKKRGVKVVTALEQYYELGKSTAVTGMGHTVTAYDMERTICDIIRRKEKMDPQVFTTALKEYMTNRDKKLPMLMRYAAFFGIESKMRTYLEVML